MNEKSKKRGAGKVFWRILFFLLIILYLAVLELGKNTLLGWGLAVIAAVSFYILRASKLASSGLGLRFLSWIGLFAVCALIFFVSKPPVKAVPAAEGKNLEKSQIITVAQGDVQGVVTKDGKVEVYTGIPYAKAPVGDLRWKEPQAPDPWEGVLTADHFKPMSMQTRNSVIYDSLAQIIGYHDYKISLNDNYVTPVSEDSLYLNVWKPEGKDLKDLPVLVYIHGGSLQTGQPWYQDYRGETLAKEGIVVVNFAYRLGIFGFFADPELAKESPNGTTGNYGLLDQIAALKWVQDNISAFGGDPNNVTVAGESAGSACVSALCTSPLAKGLFRRVLLESSTVSAPRPAHSFRLLDSAFKAAENTKERMGAATIEELRALPAEKIVGELSIHHHMTVDGYVLTETPYESYKKGIHNEEAQLQGFNREEAAPFILFSQGSMKNYEDRIRRSFGDYADEVLKLYPSTTDEEAKRNWADIDTVLLFTYGHFCLGRQAQENDIPCYMYHFTKENGRLGSWHSGEEVYLYGNIPDDSKLYDEVDRELSRQFVQYVLNYVKTGNPNGQGLKEWPLSDGGTKVLELGDEVKVTDAPYQDLYEILDKVHNF